MSKKQDFTFQNLGINRDLLFEQIAGAINNVSNAIDMVENTIESIEPKHNVHIFDIVSIGERMEMNKKMLNCVKQEFRRAASDDACNYEEIFYSAVKSTNSLIKSTCITVSLHNSLAKYYSKDDGVEIVEEPKEIPIPGSTGVPEPEPEPVPVVAKKRGRPRVKRDTVKRTTKVVKRVPLIRKLIKLENIEIKINTIIRPKNDVEKCPDCKIELMKTEEEGVLGCPSCEFMYYEEDTYERREQIIVQATETKHKRGGDLRFIELTQSIQDKLTIKDKDKALVEEAILEAKEVFPKGTKDYNDIDSFLRGSKIKSCFEPRGVKKYDKIYKYCPHIFSKVNDIELCSFTESEYIRIENVYSYISSNYRTMCVDLFGSKSGRSINAEFFLERLIDMYVLDVKRNHSLKSVMPRKNNDTNGNEMVWEEVLFTLFGIPKKSKKNP